MRRAAWAVVALLASGAARADNAADEADLAFGQGNEAYAHHRPKDALSWYFLSYRLVPNRNVLFNIARCYEALRQPDQAYRYYADLARAELSTEDQTEVRGALERLRPQVALLEVVTEPAGAEIFIDREDLGSRGSSPQTLALPPGKHRVVVKLEGRHLVEANAEVRPGGRTALRLPLPLVVGQVRVTGSPEGAWIRESPTGPEVGRVPGTLSFPPGKHLLYVGREGYATAPFLVEVTAEATGELAVALAAGARPSGKVVVTANRDNAVVRVDGAEAGFTPTVLTLPDGSHTVEVLARDTGTYLERVELRADQQLTVHAELHYAPPPVSAAAKKLLSVDEAPASVTVITREQIRAFGYATLPQALAAVRGIYVSDDREYGYFGVRGFSPPGDYNTRILILWDGHAMNDVWAGQGYAGRELVATLDEVDHIEVIRGPASTLYGTGAFFAVINVVPRASLSGPNVEVAGSAGSLGAASGHLTGSTREDPSRGLIGSASVYDAQGAPLTDMGPAGITLGNDSERAYNGSAHGRWGDFSFDALLNSRTKYIPTGLFQTSLTVPGTRATDTRGFAEIRFDHEFSPATGLSARAYYDASRYVGHWEYVGPNGSTLSEATDGGGADWVAAEARFHTGLFSGNQLTLGADSQVQLRIYQKAFGGPDVAPLETRTRVTVSGSAIDEWRLGPRLFLSLGLRVDKYSDVDTVPLSPRLAAIGHPYPGGLTKLVAGRAFRAPNVNELYYFDDYLTSRPALKLSPETIDTVELEHSHDLTPELRITAAGYYNRISDLIVFLPDNTSTPLCGGGTVVCSAYQNLTGVIQALGVEAELHWQPGPFTLVDVAYSYVSLTGASPDILSGTPAHLASGRLLVPLVDPYVRLATQVTYQSARHSPGLPQGVGESLLVSVGFSGELPHLRYFAGVQNLLDQQYALPVGQDFGLLAPVPQYGRTLHIDVAGNY